MATERQMQKAVGELGELLGRHEAGASLERFAPYRTDPVGFVREVLGEDPWSAQVEALELLANPTVDRIAWRAAQAVGKSRCIAYASLWWAYARRGQAILSAPTARSLREVLMRKEIARIWYRLPELGGELYTDSLRIQRDEPAILAFTATSASAAQGQHDPEGGVLMVLDEAQGVPPELWEALDANTTGQADVQLVCGNPLEPTGPFYEVSQSGSGWATLQTSALQHPNLQSGDRYIGGGPSEDWLERMEDRWGRESPMWQARVRGEFPVDSVEGLYAPKLVDAAMGRQTATPEEEPRREPVLAVDVARHGLDSSAAAWRVGPRVQGIETWHGASTSETAERVVELAKRVGIRRDLPDGVSVDGEPLAHLRERPYGTIVVDVIGVGAGVCDQLEAAGWPVVEFKASHGPSDGERFRRARDEAYWQLREALEGHAVALPEDAELRREMLAIKWSPDAESRVVVESKDDLRGRLGRSPDRLDAVAMALYGRTGGRRKATKTIVKW